VGEWDTILDSPFGRNPEVCMTTAPSPPPLSGVLETVLYYRDEPATRAFYEDVLGCRPIGAESDRYLFYRAGESVLLLFVAEKTREGRRLPAHGTVGPGHVCFHVPRASYETWRTYLREAGVTLEDEATWPRGKSFYFRDPDGNCLEIADGDFWPGGVAESGPI